jgi:hypothetical protein
LLSGAGAAVVRSVNLLKIAAEAEMLRYRLADTPGTPRSVRRRCLGIRASRAHVGRARRMACSVSAFRGNPDDPHSAGHQSHHSCHVWPAGREVIAKPCRAGSRAGSAAVARRGAGGTFICCSRAGREHPSPALAQQPPIARSQIMVAQWAVVFGQVGERPLVAALAARSAKVASKGAMPQGPIRSGCETNSR